jgi:hypothetical protein
VPTWGDYPTSSRPASLCPSPGERARLELVRDHYRSDGLIASIASCSVATVTHARHLLEDEGVIGYIEACDRSPRTRTPCAEPFQLVPVLPPQPEALRDGLCTRHPRGPRMWESTRNPTDRQQALAICAACPALTPCREWALSLPPLLDRQIGILGGLLVSDRDRLRRERRAAARKDRATARPAKQEARPA